jgi:hypothetical protein
MLHDAWGTQGTQKSGRANGQTFESLIALQDALNARVIKYRSAKYRYAI